MNPQLLMDEDFTYKLFIMCGLGEFLSILNKTRNFGGGGGGPTAKAKTIDGAADPQWRASKTKRENGQRSNVGVKCATYGRGLIAKSGTGGCPRAVAAR
jgi:hypothetical protein